jgi:threonine/homoserine/homoserine lactone efflux protein
MKYLRGLGIAMASVVVFLLCGLLGLFIAVAVAFTGYAIAGAVFVAFVAFGVREIFKSKPKKPPRCQ